MILSTMVLLVVMVHVVVMRVMVLLLLTNWSGVWSKSDYHYSYSAMTTSERLTNNDDQRLALPALHPTRLPTAIIE